MIIKKIFEGEFDEQVHNQFLKFSRGEFKNKYLINGKKQEKQIYQIEYVKKIRAMTDKDEEAQIIKSHDRHYPKKYSERKLTVADVFYHGLGGADYDRKLDGGT